MRYLAVVLLFSASLAHGQQSSPPCRWGLAPVNLCAALEKEAAARIVAAKTSCVSRESGVSWPTNVENPQAESTLIAIRKAYLRAQLGYEALPSCMRASLIFKFRVEKRESVELEVFDAESGDRVFRENRSIADEDADLYWIATHFFQARFAAKVINETYQTAAREGCWSEDAFKMLASYSDSALVGKHFGCRGEETKAGK